MQSVQIYLGPTQVHFGFIQGVGHESREAGAVSLGCEQTAQQRGQVAELQACCSDCFWLKASAHLQQGVKEPWQHLSSCSWIAAGNSHKGNTPCVCSQAPPPWKVIGIILSSYWFCFLRGLKSTHHTWKYGPCCVCEWDTVWKRSHNWSYYEAKLSFHGTSCCQNIFRGHL